MATFTREQLLAERERRQSGGENTVTSAPTFTREELLAERDRRQANGSMGIDFNANNTLEDSGIGSTIAGVVEPLATVASSAIAEPVAGLAGIAQSLNPFADAGAGTRAVEATREALTFQPRTKAGQESLQSVGETLAPVGEAITTAEDFLGDTTLELTGSPALAAAASSIPTVAMELVGLKGFGGAAKRTKTIAPTSREVRKAVINSAPSPEDLKNVSRNIYKELDNSGVAMRKNVYRGMLSKITKQTKGAGLDARVTPKAAGALDVMRDTLGSAPSLTEIDTLRKVAQGVAKNIDPTEKALGNIMIAEIDSFLDVLPKSAFEGGAQLSGQVGKKYKSARDLWGRARKSELLAESIEKAGSRASGLENGLRVELDKISNNKKLSKFFNKDEKALMRDISKGNKSQNIAKLLGRFGFSEGRATNVLAALSGVGFGGIAGGGLGAFVVPAVGTVSRQVAQKLTSNRVDFLEGITKAGSDGEKIAKAYLTNVPKTKRSVDELSGLLSDPSVDLSGMVNQSNKLMRESAEIANGRRIIGEAVGISAAGAASSQNNQNLTASN